MRLAFAANYWHPGIVLTQLKTELGLASESHSVGKNIEAMCLLFITDNLDMLKGKGLAEFGAVSPQETAYLDPKLDEIIQHLYEMIKISKASPELT